MSKAGPTLLSSLASAVRDLGVYAFSRWRLPQWKRLADFYLKEAKVTYGTEGLRTHGRVGNLEVSIAGVPGRTQVVVTLPGSADFNEVSIRHERDATWKMQELEIGSEIFDRMFFLGGPARLTLALLDVQTRYLLMRAGREIPNRFEIVGGAIVAELPERQLPRLLPLLFQIGDRLAQPLDVKERLLHNASRDLEAGVRLRNLLALTREDPHDPEVREVLLSACSDRSPEVRLRAAKALGAEGIPVLVKLLEEMADDTLCAEALASLGPELTPEHARGVLRRSLATKPFPQTARAAMVALSREGEAAVGVLAEVLDHESEPLAVFAAETLQRLGSPTAEGALIQALQKGGAALRLAVAKALGPLGSPEAVVPLQQAGERFSREPEFVLATHQTIAEIQARLPGASPGQLSLAQTEAGQLSLSTEPAGQLSLTGTASPDLTHRVSVTSHENESPAGRHNS